MQHPEPHDLTALAYDLVEGPEREQLLTHLAACDACRAIYDSFREEQALVRDAIVRDARSGPAEARALERTLVMLGAQGTEEAAPRARRIALPLWAWAAQAAAMVVVALTLFFVLTPSEPDVLPVAENLRGADVRTGTALVADNGAWKQAEAVPYDVWTRAGDQLTIELPEGGHATLAPDSVFNIAMDATVNAPVLTVLAGNGEVHAASHQLLVRTGDARIHTMPGGQLVFMAQGDAGDAAALRSWSMPKDAQATVAQGYVLVVPGSRRYGSVALRGGESMRWTPDNFEARNAKGDVLDLAFTSQRFSNSEDVQHFERQIQELILRLDEVADKHDKLKSEQWFLQNKEQWRALGKSVQVMIQVDGPSQVSSVGLALGDINASAWTTAAELGFEVSRDHSRLRFTESSPESLRDAVPAEHHELLDLFTFQVDGKAYKVVQNKGKLAEYRKKHGLAKQE